MGCHVGKTACAMGLGVLLSRTGPCSKPLIIRFAQRIDKPSRGR